MSFRPAAPDPVPCALRDGERNIRNLIDACKLADCLPLQSREGFGQWFGMTRGETSHEVHDLGGEHHGPEDSKLLRVVVVTVENVELALKLLERGCHECLDIRVAHPQPDTH